MPIFHQGYRTYEGPRRDGSRALAIAWENVRTRMRRWIWVLLIVGWLPFIVQAVFVFIVTIGRKMMGGAPIPAGSVPTEAFDVPVMSPQALLGMLAGDSLAFLWAFLENQTIFAVVITAVAAAGMLADDRRTSATQIYFARPVTRLDYLGGKLLATAFFTFLVTGLPALVLWIECALFADDVAWALHTWHGPFVILVATAFYALWASAIVLFLSSLVTRARTVAVGALLFYLVTLAVPAILREVFKDETWLVFSPVHYLGSLTAGFFGLDLPSWAQSPWVLVQGVAIPLLLLGATWWRVGGMERGD